MKTKTQTKQSVFPKALGIFIIFTLICGVVYTGVVTGIAQLIFPKQANGSIIEIDGKNTAASCSVSNMPITHICGDEL